MKRAEVIISRCSIAIWLLIYYLSHTYCSHIDIYIVLLIYFASNLHRCLYLYTMCNYINLHMCDTLRILFVY